MNYRAAGGTCQTKHRVAKSLQHCWYIWLKRIGENDGACYPPKALLGQPLLGTLLANTLSLSKAPRIFLSPPLFIWMELSIEPAHFFPNRLKSRTRTSCLIANPKIPLTVDKTNDTSTTNICN